MMLNNPSTSFNSPKVPGENYHLYLLLHNVFLFVPHERRAQCIWLITMTLKNNHSVLSL